MIDLTLLSDLTNATPTVTAFEDASSVSFGVPDEVVILSFRQVVPEPGTFALFSVGVAGLLGRRRLRTP